MSPPPPPPASRLILPAFIALLAAIGIAAACSDAPDNTDPTPSASPEPIIWWTAKLPAPPEDLVYPALHWRQAAEHHQRLPALIAEREAWCAGEPTVAQLRQMIDRDGAAAAWNSIAVPLSDTNHAWLDEVFSRTAERRGAEPSQTPRAQTISIPNLRRLNCAWIDSDDAIDHPALAQTPISMLERLTGIRSPLLAPRWEHLLTDGGILSVDPTNNHWLDLAGDGRAIHYFGVEPLGFEYAVRATSYWYLRTIQDELTPDGTIMWLQSAGSSDAREARRWLIEGDATAAALPLVGREAIVLRNAYAWGSAIPLEWDAGGDPSYYFSFLQNFSLNAAYSAGQTFVQRIIDDDGRDALNALYRNPPATMEQVLHPDKLASREPPQELSGVDMLRDGVFASTDWLPPDLDRIGELGLRTLWALASGDRARFHDAAAGWGGDQLALWRSRDGGREVVTWQLAFDTSADLIEAGDAMRHWLIVWSDGEAVGSVNYPPLIGWEAPQGSIRLVTLEDSLWLVAANGEGDADAVALAIVSAES